MYHSKGITRIAYPWARPARNSQPNLVRSSEKEEAQKVVALPQPFLSIILAILLVATKQSSSFTLSHATLPNLSCSSRLYKLP